MGEDGRDPQCACDACALLFEQPGGKLVRASREVKRLDGSAFDGARLLSLGVPVGLVFFVRRVAGGVTAWYPGPAGALASEVDPSAWQALAQALPEIEALAPAAEALFVRRRGERSEAWRLPVDLVWRLTALLRNKWVGLDGGAEARAELDRFVESLPGGRPA